MKFSFTNLMFLGLLFGALNFTSCTPEDSIAASAQPMVQLDENTPPSTGDVINRAVYMALRANGEYNWDGYLGELPQIIPGPMAFDMIQWNSMELDPAIPDYLYSLLNEPGAKAVLIAGVPATDGSGQIQNHIYIDLRNTPGQKPYELEGAPGISLADIATPNAGCTKKIIRIGYDGPVKDFCGCIPHYGCNDDCTSCSEISNVREFVLSQMGPHPLLDIEVPYEDILPEVELSEFYP